MHVFKMLRVPSFLLLTVVILVLSTPSSSAENNAIYPDFSCLPGFAGSSLVAAIEKECGHDTNKDGCNKACIWGKYKVLLKNKQGGKGLYARALGDALDVHMELSKLFKPGSKEVAGIVRKLSHCLPILNDLDESKYCPCDNNGWKAVFECFDAAIGCMPVSLGQLVGCYDSDKPDSWKARSRNSMMGTASCCEKKIMNCFKYKQEGTDQNVCQVVEEERVEQMKKCCETKTLVSYAPPDPRTQALDLKPCE